MNIEGTLVPVIERCWDHVNNCEPIYPMPCIVWWQKGYGTDIWYKGELLCKEYPYGELYSTNLYLENLIDSLTELYQEEVLMFQHLKHLGE